MSLEAFELLLRRRGRNPGIGAEAIASLLEFESDGDTMMGLGRSSRDRERRLVESTLDDFICPPLGRDCGLPLKLLYAGPRICDPTSDASSACELTTERVSSEARADKSGNLGDINRGEAVPWGFPAIMGRGIPVERRLAVGEEMLNSSTGDSCSCSPLACTNVEIGVNLIGGFTSAESERTDCASDAWKNMGDDPVEPSAKELGREMRPIGGVSTFIGFVVTIFETSIFAPARIGLLSRRCCPPPLLLDREAAEAPTCDDEYDGRREWLALDGVLVLAGEVRPPFFSRGPVRGVTLLALRNGPEEAETDSFKELALLGEGRRGLSLLLLSGEANLLLGA